MRPGIDHANLSSGVPMWSITPATRIFLAQDPIDLRRSFNGLYAAVSQILKQNPLSVHLFVFMNRRQDKIKIFFWDGTGIWVCAKRLERGRFTLPQKDTLSAAEFSLLLGGIDMRKTKSKKWLKDLNGIPMINV